MRYKKVIIMRCHVGVQLGTDVTTSVDSVRHKVEMELVPVGVLITPMAGSKLKCPELIPFTNITSMRVAEAVDCEEVPMRKTGKAS